MSHAMRVIHRLGELMARNLPRGVVGDMEVATNGHLLLASPATPSAPELLDDDYRRKCAEYLTTPSPRPWRIPDLAPPEILPCPCEGEDVYCGHCHGDGEWFRPQTEQPVALVDLGGLIVDARYLALAARHLGRDVMRSDHGRMPLGSWSPLTMRAGERVAVLMPMADDDDLRRKAARL